MAKIKTAYRLILRVWNVLLLAAVFLGGSTLIPAAAAQAQRQDVAPGELQPAAIILVPGTVPVDEASAEAVAAALNRAPDLFPELNHFAITDVRQSDDWALVSVIGLAPVHEGPGWGIDDGAWFGLVLLWHEPPGSWLGAAQGTREFSAQLENVPASFIEEGARQDIDPRQRVRMVGNSYIFPWQPGTAMYYGALGVHNNGFSFGDHVGWKAVDMLSDGNTTAGRAPNRLLAAVGGTIGYKCTDPNNVAVLLGDFFYTHLVDNAGLQVGLSFSQGAELGQMKVGTFGTQGSQCGWAQQSDGWFHVHWGFPDADLQVEAWTLSMSTQNWTNGSMTVTPGGGWIVANGQSSPQISGNAGDAGVVLSYDDGGPKTVTADATGAYALAVPGGWSGEVTPALPGFRFDPVSRLYANVSAHQTGQDYRAIALARARPADGEVVCRRPDIGVDLTLTDFTRGSDRSFDLFTVMLMLDGLDVTGQASIRAATVHPAVSADIVYTPGADLQDGPHIASFTYPTEAGPTTLSWDFTVQENACAEALMAPAIGEVSTASPESLRAKTSTPASTDTATPDQVSPGSERNGLKQNSPPSSGHPTSGFTEAAPAATTRLSQFSESAPLLSGGPLACLPLGLTCPRTILIKE